MKTVLFCGGTRIKEYSESIPNPMIPVGEKPILWHLMHYYSQYGCGKTGCFLAVRPSFSLHSSTWTHREA